jgi:cytochrome c peroxidase
MLRRTRAWVIGAAILALSVAAGAPEDPPPIPPGLTRIVWPRDNPYTREKAELGRLLFFDKRLSIDETISCASCHDPAKGFSNGAAYATGVRGQKGNRSAPTIFNRAFSLEQFWDGRAATLEEQAKGPIANPIEMDMPHDKLEQRLRGIAGYRERFRRVFGTEEITIDHVAKAIATFERTILSGNAPYDRFVAGDTSALSPAAQRGRKIFFEKARCDQCHGGSNFTDGSYANLGVGMDYENPDLGRYQVTRREQEKGAFKTPTLRELTSTAPYMHDGLILTLEDVVDFYNKGGIRNRWLDPKIKPLNLTREEQQELVEFLKSLSGGEGWRHATAPTEFPR